MMFFSAFALAALMSGMQTVFAAPQNNALPTVTVTDDITFTGPVKPGGENITFTGSVEQIWKHVHELNPSYDQDFKEFQASHSDLTTAVKAEKILCGLWRGADDDRIDEGISYLKGLNGDCSLSAGPGKCGRVSCSWESGISWCNDNESTKTIPCSEIGVAAQQLSNKCSVTGDYWSGQIFMPGKWNTMVTWSDC